MKASAAHLIAMVTKLSWQPDKKQYFFVSSHIELIFGT